MKIKMLEIRDSLTTIPVMALKTEPQDADEMRFFDRAGFSDDTVILIKLAGGAACEYDCFKWQDDGSRTMFHAHRYIADNFDDICDKSVIDVEYILDERKEPKKSEIWR